MQGLVLVTRPAAKSSGTATRGRCCSASVRPDSTASRVATDRIITTFAGMSRTALVADAAYARVITLARRQLDTRHAKLDQRVLDLGALDAVTDPPHVDDAFCCIGTTIKKAGSQ